MLEVPQELHSEHGGEGGQLWGDEGGCRRRRSPAAGARRTHLRVGNTSAQTSHATGPHVAAKTKTKRSKMRPGHCPAPALPWRPYSSVFEPRQIAMMSAPPMSSARRPMQSTVAMGTSVPTKLTNP